MYDVVIVGGGPAGLSAALILGRACRKVVVIDAGQPRNGTAQAVNGFLGCSPLAPHELRERGRDQVKAFGVEIHSGRVIAAERISSGDHRFPTQFQVRTEEGRTALGRKLLLTTGVTDELPEIPGLRECYGISIHHCPYCDGWEHRNEPLLALGEQAKEAARLALGLRSWSERVAALTNGQRLAAKEKDQLAKNGVELYEEPVVRVLHDQGRLRAVELAGGRAVEAHGLFFSGSQRQQSDLAVQLGTPMDDDEHAKTTEKQRTRVPGLFLAGDADGDVQFAIVAAAEGATSAVAINRELQEEDRL